MTSSISFTRAAQVGVCAIAADLFLNQGRTISGLLLATLGSSAIEILKETILAGERARYRVIKSAGFEFPNETDSLKRAFHRLSNEYPEDWGKYLAEKQLLSEQEILDHFKIELAKGCCYGIASALFDKILRGERVNIQDSVRQISSEDVFYHQISQKFTTFSTRGAELILRSKLRNKQIFWLNSAIEALKLGKQPDSLIGPGIDIEAEILKMQSRHPLLAFSSSDCFRAKASCSIYQVELEKVMAALDKENIVGVIDLPKHVICFQYGPAGYYIYDSFNRDKGLYQYDEPATFFEELRKHVLYDLQTVKVMALQEQNPNLKSEELLEDVTERVKKIEISYKIHGLTQVA